jgi:hypothetical protein
VWLCCEGFELDAVRQFKMSRKKKKSNYYIKHGVNVTVSAAATGVENASKVNSDTVNTSEVNAL